jgi:hypothetical protein
MQIITVAASTMKHAAADGATAEWGDQVTDQEYPG